MSQFQHLSRDLSLDRESCGRVVTADEVSGVLRGVVGGFGGGLVWNETVGQSGSGVMVCLGELYNEFVVLGLGVPAIWVIQYQTNFLRDLFINIASESSPEL